MHTRLKPFEAEIYLLWLVENLKEDPSLPIIIGQTS